MSRLAGVYPTELDGGLGIAAPGGDGARALVGVSSGGVANQVLSFADPDDARSVLGVGPLARAVVDQLALGGGVVHAVPAGVGTPAAVTPDGANPAGPAVTLTGSATDRFSAVIRITRAGALGVGAFAFSLDGGDTYSQEIALAATYAIPDSGLTANFAAGAYVAGSLYRFEVSEPLPSVATAQAAIRAALGSGRVFEYVQVVGGSGAAMWAALDALAAEAEAAFKYVYFVCETTAPGSDPDAWVTAQIAAKAAFSSIKVQIIAAYGEVVDTLSGRVEVQSLASRIMARVSRNPVHVKASYRRLGALPGVVCAAPFVLDAQNRKVSKFNNGHAKSLDEAGFTTVVTMEGRSGLYVEEDRMAAPLTSDYTIAPNRRVMNKAKRLVREALLEDVQGNLDPLELEASTQSIVARANAPLKAMVRDREVSAARVALVPGQNILSDSKLRLKVRITPNGYAREIETEFAYENPFLG
ncbi:MAG: DUF2586 family protein [Meiothermus sp.]|nr:DUF2586 family protein [Meiothermus sp.]